MGLTVFTWAILFKSMAHKHQASQLHQLYWIATMKPNPTISFKTNKQTKNNHHQIYMFNFKNVMSEFDAITGYRYMYLSTASENTKCVLMTFKIKSGSYWRRVLNCVVLLHFNSSCYTSTSVLKLQPKKLFLDLRCQKNQILGFVQL